MKKRLIVGPAILACVALASSLAGVSASSAASRGTLKIGALMDQSSFYAFIGNPALAGLQSYVAGVNKSGGINGYKLKVVSIDTHADPVATRSGFTQLRGDGVIGVVGPNDSTTLVPLAPLVKAAKIPDLSLAALTTLNTPAEPYLFASGLPVAYQAVIAANWMKTESSKLGITNPKVAILTLQTPAVAELVSGLVSAIPKVDHGTVVANETVPVTATDLTTEASTIIAAKPDFVQVGLLPTQVPSLVQALRNAGIEAPVMNYFVASDPSTFVATNDSGYYAVRDFAAPDENQPGNTAMRKAAVAAGQLKSFNTDTSYFTYGYVSGELLGAAIKQCGSSCTAVDVNKALEKIRDFNSGGLAGPLGVNPPHDNYFVTYGKVFGWNSTSKKSVQESGWLKG
jgi:branched-chain amino acid transport system substrate-binding protein